MSQFTQLMRLQLLLAEVQADELAALALGHSRTYAAPLAARVTTSRRPILNLEAKHAVQK